MLRGRRRECTAIDRLLEAARTGQSEALVLRGEAGIGKTALLDYAVERATGFRVARAIGVESEMELAFAALHQVCAPMLDRLDCVPGPQRASLHTAFGLSAGGTPDRFLVGLAVLSLLSEIAEEQPLLCVIDDAQWLDQASAQALAFAARRMYAESVALLIAMRDPNDVEEPAGLPELSVVGLADGDARELLATVVRGRLDEQVRDRIVAETRGNPLALLELPRGLTSAQLAGGFGLLDGRSLASRIELSFQRRLGLLPPETQLLLLAAAAEPVGDMALLWRAAGRLGIEARAAAPAEKAGLIDLGARVRFPHPLMRSAVYRAARLADRQAVHSALAEATDPEIDPDRRAWHRARAAIAPDTALADELERSADRAQGRGGVAAAAAFLERAAELTPDPARRGARALAAAEAKLEAGASARASELLTTAELGPLDELQHARLARLRARVEFARTRGSDAPPLLLTAAKRLEPLDVGLARETYLEALGAAMFAGPLGGGRGVREAAEAGRRAPRATQPPRPVDLLLEGLSTRFSQGYAAGVSPLERALRAFCRDDGDGEDDLRWLWLACRVAPDMWDDEAWYVVAERQLRLARDAGALIGLGFATTYRAGVHVHAGEFDAASALNEEAAAITRATGSAPLMYTSLVLAAWRGQEAQTMELIEASVRDATVRGEGRAITIADYARALLNNGLGRYQAALGAAQRASEHDQLGLLGWALIELVEAAVRSGHPDVAADALRRLGERTQASGTDWALGIEARSRALLTDGRPAEAHHREAIERLTSTRIVVHLARAHLAYGEWLRRNHRRVDARHELQVAYDMFESMGAEAFAERTARELLATGEHARKRKADTRDELTAQEAQIARLAANGHSNPEIGAQLFISRRTVEYHLHKVFSKLGISSRNHLHEALGGAVEGRDAHPTGVMSPD